LPERVLETAAGKRYCINGNVLTFVPVTAAK
jgi:peptide methionine sulfoxide reductase MsrB